MSYTSGRLTAEMNTRAVGRRHDNSFLSLRTVPNAARPAAVTTDITVNPSYTVTGVGVSFRIDRSTAVFARFDNVTDTKWEGVLGYPGLPRAVVAGVRFGGP
jgi:outer membrane cobalamin receptor